MIDGLITATQVLFTPDGVVVMLVGVVLGLLVGVLPGIGGAGATALLIPLTYAMSPELAISFLMAVGTSSGLGGQITSILVNIPGDPPNAATTLDGYPMTRKGKAAEALGAATFGSVFGAIFGTIGLLLLLPVARDLVLSFSYEEFFMIMLTGLVLIAGLTRGNTFKGLIAAGLGLMVAFIGLNPLTGQPRFDFGFIYLYDGIDIVPALVGLFAGAEMLVLFSTKTSPVLIKAAEGVRESRFIDGLWATFRAWRVLLVSSVIGFLIGVIPGLGSTVGSFVAYGQSRRFAREPEMYGKGAVEGVIASETANDADKGGALLPTIAFGIPGGTLMAVLAAGLLLHGVQMGPSLFRQDQHILYVLVVASLVPRMIAAGIVTILGKRAVAFTRIRGDILAPVIVVICMVGVYAVRNQILDVVVALVFSYIGYAMEKFGFSRVAFIIALVLGSDMELTFHQSLQAHGWLAFFTRPISLSLFILAMLTLFGPPLVRGYRRLRERRAAAA